MNIRSLNDIIYEKRNRCVFLVFNEEDHTKGKEIGRRREVQAMIIKVRPECA